MVVLVVLYGLVALVLAVGGLAQISMNLDWEDCTSPLTRKRALEDLLMGWRIVKFSLVWPLLLAAFLKGLALGVRHAADTKAQGE